MTFLLNLTDSCEVHIPLANVIVDEELLNAIARILNVLPTVTTEGLYV
jgi:hypothetical protein